MKIINKRDGRPSENRSVNFTGTVWGDALSATGQEPTINNVIFTPKARTYWHQHERGQLLVGVNGLGLVVTESGQAAVLGVGDIVWIEGGEVHWHGAASDSILTLVATSFGTTKWLDEVIDDQYEQGLSAAGLL